MAFACRIRFLITVQCDGTGGDMRGTEDDPEDEPDRRGRRPDEVPADPMSEEDWIASLAGREDDRHRRPGCDDRARVRKTADED
jgi:hypothetical protein